MPQVVLTGKDWTARALLRAQLLEEGLDVQAHETVEAALASLEASPALPSLFIADLSSSDNPSAEADQLAALSKQYPVWIIANRALIVDKTLRGRGFEIVLVRPIDMKELVEQIMQRLGATD